MNFREVSQKILLRTSIFQVKGLVPKNTKCEKCEDKMKIKSRGRPKNSVNFFCTKTKETHEVSLQ